MIPTVGTIAPDFTLLDQEGNAHTLSAYRGKRVLLYFYPKDDTPGCTKEACMLRDAIPDFTKLEAEVFGVSVDSVKSHKKFAEKYGLPFTLLADEEKEVVNKYGVWGKKKMMGREYDGIFRTSFLIAADGTIEKVYENVKPETHAAEVLQDLRHMTNSHSSTPEERKARARKIVSYLKKTYPVPETELTFKTPIQLVVAVMLSAQSTDKRVNLVTKELYKRYKTVNDFADSSLASFTEEISSITFYKNKARHIKAMATMIRDEFKGKVPKTEAELVRLPGVAYKTAHVILGELHDIWEGIPTDTHVRRFALRFDLTSNTDLTKISKDLEALIPKKDWKYVNNGFVLYGRYVCSALPHPCEGHPLTKLWPPAAQRWPKAK